MFKIEMKMLILYFSLTFGIVSLTNIAKGDHPIVPVGDSLGYRDVSRSDGRFAQAAVSPPRTAIRRRGRMLFVDRRRPLFQQPHPDTIAFQTFMRKYQELQNRRMGPTIISQSRGRPFVFNPSMTHRTKSHTLRQFNLRKPPQVENINKHTLYHPPVAAGNKVPSKDGFKTTEKNSLLTLLEERKSVIRDDNDLILIRKHLIEINSLGSTDGLTEDQVLEKQVEYIENITDIDIQREVLKIFVKDIVEKSGFLSQNISSVHDIDTLKALVDRISSVTDKFSQLSDKLAIDSLRMLKDARGGLERVQLNVASTTTSPATSSKYAISSEQVTDSEHSLRQKILSALSIYDKTARATHAPINLTERGMDTFKSRPRSNLEPTAGMSIFGDVTTKTSTMNSQTVEIKRGPVGEEPLGGNNAYWTHLRAGLVDMLCNLCRQQNRASCIIRYCTNDLVRTETETPAPSAVITA